MARPVLLVASGTAPVIVDGGTTLFVGLAGFAVWVSFVVRASIALVRVRG